ncbi:hypothetical protein J6590_021214 [Homalodisca vitripennis]|nr:hypothetical protein J6590_021214 [Homalodisca vitripennis]
MTNCMIHKALKFGQPRYLRRIVLYRDEVSHRRTRYDKELPFLTVRLDVGTVSMMSKRFVTDFIGSLQTRMLPPDSRRSVCHNVGLQTWKVK